MGNYGESSSLFSSFGSRSMNSFDFGNYAAIRSGSYRKLLKSYYGQQKMTASDQTNKTGKTDAIYNNAKDIDKTGLTKMKKEADSLRTAVSNLNKEELWNPTNGSLDKDKIASGVKDFVSNYNSVIDQVGKVSSNEVSRSARWMTNMTNTMSKALAKVGITVGSDQKLTLDEDALKKANDRDIKAVFEGSYSYADQISQKASGISNAATQSASFYLSNGRMTYSMPSMFEGWV